MTIERLEPLARQPHRLKIHLSDGSALTTQDYVAADLGLYPGKVLEEQDYQALLEAVSLAAAKNRAVRMIAAAGHSRQDLQRKLVQKGEDPVGGVPAGYVEDQPHLGILKKSCQLLRPFRRASGKSAPFPGVEASRENGTKPRLSPKRGMGIIGGEAPKNKKGWWVGSENSRPQAKLR